MMIRTLYPYLLMFAGLGVLSSVVLERSRLATLAPARRRWISLATLVAFLCQGPLVLQKLLEGTGWDGWLSAFGIVVGTVGSIFIWRIGKGSARENLKRLNYWRVGLGFVALLLGDGLLYWAYGQRAVLPVVIGGVAALAVFAMAMVLFR
ncbi:MAG: hypothetical protein WBS54_11950 [Acidobacteriota bacterium]